MFIASNENEEMANKLPHLLNKYLLNGYLRNIGRLTINNKKKENLLGNSLQFLKVKLTELQHIMWLDELAI